MNEQQAQAQIQQMKSFILKEAEEKRDELLAKAEEECEIEKQRLIRQEKKKIREDFERKEKQAEVQKRIAFSHEYNAARLTALKAQDECTQALVAKAKARLEEYVADEGKYSALLKDLIAQAMLVIDEAEVIVACREKDVALVKKVLPDALNEYKTRFSQKKTAADDENDPEFKAAVKAKLDKVKLSVDEKNFLPDSTGGGVVLRAFNGRIMCSNTIESRLAIATEGRLPDIRRILFPLPLRKTALGSAASVAAAVEEEKKN